MIYKTKLTATIQHDYFSEENMKLYPERFTIVGFIAADGCIRQQKTGQLLLIFNISEKDQCVLDFINNELTLGIRNLSRVKKTNSLMLTIPSTQICNDLLKYNITQRKTNTLNFPNLNKIQTSFYIKGYFYGDGCINSNDRLNSTNCFIVGNNIFCDALKIYLENNNIVDNCKIYSLNKHNKNYKQIHITGRDSHKFTNYMFSNNIFNFLPRKTQIIDDYIFNSKWTKYELSLLLELGKNNIDEFVKLTGRTKKTAKEYYWKLIRNKGVLPFYK